MQTTGSLYDYQHDFPPPPSILDRSGSNQPVPAVIGLDSSHFLVVYANSPTNVGFPAHPGLLAARIGTVNGTVITYGPEFASSYSASQFTGDYISVFSQYRNMEITQVDSASYCVMFDEEYDPGPPSTNGPKTLTILTTDTSNNYAVTWSLNKFRPGVGPPGTPGTEGAGFVAGYRCGLDAIDTNLFVFAGRVGATYNAGSGVETYDNFVYLFQVTQSTQITYLGRKNVGYGPQGFRVRKLDTRKFLVIATNGATEISGSIFTLSGTTLVEGPETSVYGGTDGVLASDPQLFTTEVRPAGPNAFVFLYDIDPVGTRPTLINYCTLNGTTIVPSTVSGTLMFSGSSDPQNVNDLILLRDFNGTDHTYQALAVDTRAGFPNPKFTEFSSQKVLFSNSSNKFTLYGTGSTLNVSGALDEFTNSFFNSRITPLTFDKVVVVGRNSNTVATSSSPSIIIDDNEEDIIRRCTIYGAKQIYGTSKIKWVL